MPGERIVVIEDEDEIQELLRYNLEREGFTVETASTGEEGLRAVKRQPPDLVLLDLMLPGVDGLEVCRRIKRDRATEDTPVIILSAKGEEADVVTGLELGADDYVPKPFKPRELVARVRALLRRARADVVAAHNGGASDRDDEVIVVRASGHSGGPSSGEPPDLVIHPGRFEVLVRGRRVPLTLTEFRVLHFLARRPGWVYTRYQIVNAVKGPDYPVTERSVDVQIVGLRRKLGVVGDHVETVRGVGYRFKEQQQ